VIHDGERLTLRLEAKQHCAVTHTGPNEFERRLPPHRSGLFCQPNLPHNAFTEFFSNR
jgi:hypothetical protein